MIIIKIIIRIQITHTDDFHSTGTWLVNIINIIITNICLVACSYFSYKNLLIYAKRLFFQFLQQVFMFIIWVGF